MNLKISDNVNLVMAILKMIRIQLTAKYIQIFKTIEIMNFRIQLMN